ncbi:MAG: hypothetical protein CMB47_03320 [Euryarchaeota archaeon]|nr:hypothetical protein [Euryarchaeota archaeon]
MSLDKITPPDRFTGLHSHTTFSTFDAIGYPSDHIDFITSDPQGGDSWAITDHGNGNGLGHANAHSNIIKKSGRKYRQLYGVEFYFVPSLKTWQEQYTAHREAVQAEKDAKKKEKMANAPVIVDAEKEIEAGGHIIEDENETKESSKGKPAWKRYYHLVVIAKNRTGLTNLFTLVKKSYKHGFYRFPRIDFEMLKEHGEGLVVSTACVGGLASGIIYNEFQDYTFDQFHPDLLNDPTKYNTVMKRLTNMTDYFVDCVGQENFFLELQFNKLTAQQMTNRMLLDLSKNTGIKLVATADSHYPNPNVWEARELYKKLGWFSNDPKKMILPKEEDLKCLLYPKNAQQMWSEFTENYNEYDFYKGYETDVRDAINRTNDIAWQLCEDTWIDQSAKLPLHGTTDKPAFNILVDLVKDGLIREGLDKNQEYIDRAKQELADIKTLGHESYFITMYQIFEKSSKKTLLGPGRGSGAGSLVNFLLGITQLDPIEYGLLWARFLGPHKVSWPDIDTDAGDRDVLIEASKELYGEESVIPVSNFNTLKLKSLLKDVCKFYNVPFMDVNKLTAGLQEEVMPFARGDNEEKSMFMLKHEDCMQYSKRYKTFMEKYPDVERQISSLFLQNRSIGRHAGGVIIAPEKDLTSCMPIISVRGELQTPWSEGMNVRNLEPNGFLKFDFLGLTLLRDVENCIRRILKKQGNEDPTFLDVKAFFDKHLNCRNVKMDDPKVWKHVYEDGRLTAIFQFTADGARRFCLEAKPTDIETLGALTAIYRPGPLKANVHQKFVQAKRDKDSVVYAHPEIKKVLSPTFNHIVFQEQFMMLAQNLAGFTPGESDKLRKTLVKMSHDSLGGKKNERQIAKEKFIKGAKDIHSIDEKVTTDLWERIEAFSTYGFNKSHAIAYAIDSYYGAWLHTHHETEWLATILDSENNNPNGLTKTISEIKSYGYKIVDADINYSGTQWEYSEEVNAFVPPLSSIKGVGDAAMNEVMESRPFRNIKELLYDNEGNWKWSKFNKSAIKSLCTVEALGSLEEFTDGTLNNHHQLLQVLTDDKNYDVLRKHKSGLTKTQRKKLEKQGEFPSDHIDSLFEKYKDVVDWTRMEKIENYATMTSTIKNNLVFPDEIMDQIRLHNVPCAFDIPEGARKQGWFSVIDKTKKKSKNNRVFWSLKIIDNQNNTKWLRVWGDFHEGKEPEKYTFCLADIHNDAQWGMSTNAAKFKIIPLQ